MRSLEQIIEDERGDKGILKEHIKQYIIPPTDETLPPTTDSDDNPLTVYTDGIHNYPSNHYIIESIDWQTIPENHPLHGDKPRQHHQHEKRQYIQEYARQRGSVLHKLIGSRKDEYDYSEHIHSINFNFDDFEEAYTCIADWDASTETNPSDNPYDTEDAIHRAARREADQMELEWMQWTSDNNIETLRHEYTYAHNIKSLPRGRGHGGRADLVVSIPDDSPLDIEAGIYAPDIKTSPNINHSHRMQAEAHRRALSSILDEEVGGMILKVSPDDISIETHHDDSWPSDILWETFCQKLQYLYDDTLLDIHLTLADA